jgi:hypothetical protein
MKASTIPAIWLPVKTRKIPAKKASAQHPARACKKLRFMGLDLSKGRLERRAQSINK